MDVKAQRAKRKTGASTDKDPYDRRAEKDTRKAFKSVDKSVKPVAKDTNKTRRKETLRRKESETVIKTGKPHKHLKSEMKKKMMNEKPGSLKCRKM